MGLGLILRVLSLALVLSACSSQEPIKLGFISGQTGRFADLGTGGLHGAIMAVEWRNAAGGVAGHPVSLLIRDDQHKIDQAKAGANSLLKEGVLAIIGPMTSAMAVELIPLANTAQTVIMGGTIVTNKVSARDDYFLRAISATARYARNSARIHRQHTQATRAVVLYDLANREYSEDWARDYAAEFVKEGGQAPLLFGFDSRSTQDPTPLAELALESAPELIVMICSPGSAASLVRAIRQRNGSVRLAGAAWAASPLLIEGAGKDAEGMLVEQYHNVADHSARFEHFKQDYRKRFNREPDYSAVVSFDAANIVLDALAQNPQRKGLKETLLKIARFEGLQGEIVLDRYGDAERPRFMTEVRNAQFQPLPGVQP